MGNCFIWRHGGGAFVAGVIPGSAAEAVGLGHLIGAKLLSKNCTGSPDSKRSGSHGGQTTFSFLMPGTLAVVEGARTHPPLCPFTSVTHERMYERWTDRTWECRVACCQATQPSRY
eukprot:gene12407-biopygen3915